MKILKLVLKIIGGLIGLIVVVIVGASVFIMLYVDKPLVEEQMQKALNRHVTISSINVGIFSVLSGIEVTDVKISNFKTTKEMEAIKGKPVPENDLFVGLKTFKFKVAFGPLLQKKFVLKELMLYTPVVNITRDKNGFFNFSDLMIPKKMTPEEKAEFLKKQQEEAAAAAKAAKEPKKPLTADDIPISVSIGKIGMENGQITFVDTGLNQTVQLYSVTAKVYDIEIDSKDLAKKDNVKLTVSLGIKTIGQVKSGSVQSFDIMFDVNGNITPFDKKTRVLEPEISLKLGSKKGTVTGLQIFDKLDSVDALAKYTGKVSFLKKAITWSDAYTGVWFKAGTVKLDGGRVKTDDYQLTFKGTHNINSKMLDVDLDMIVADKHKAEMKKGIEGNLKKIITGSIAKVAKPEKIAEDAMKPLLNDKGQVYLKYKVTGTTVSPKTDLVHPKLPSLSDLVKKAAGDVGDMAKDKAKEAADKAKKEAEEAAKKKAEEEKKKAASKLKKKVKF